MFLARSRNQIKGRRKILVKAMIGNIELNFFKKKKKDFFPGFSQKKKKNGQAMVVEKIRNPTELNLAIMLCRRKAVFLIRILKGYNQ